MSRRLPPLNALRAFEAAARHLSFTAAASELFVTQAAISHQVKALEEHLGQPLFRRLNRKLELTEAGRFYRPLLTEAFDLIDTASQRVRARDEQGPLKISVLPSFAAKWLLPRLGGFRALHPEIDVLVSSKLELADFARDDIDLALRFGRGNYPGLRTTWLMSDSKFPVCSPRLLEGPHPLRRPEDLRHHTLLHDEVSGGPVDVGWPEWLELAELTDIDAGRGPGFSDAAMVLAAAMAGQGVALSRGSLANDDLAAGLLVVPFGPEVATGHAYYIVMPPEAYEREKVRLFHDWLLGEAEASQAQDRARET
jgi:LysR family glycine cleavage system transcriptional activator